MPRDDKGTPTGGGSYAGGSDASLGGTRRRARRQWAREGRAHIEVRGLQRSDASRIARQVESELGSLRGVDWAAVNQVLGRVVVAFDEEQSGAGDLLGVTVYAARYRHVTTRDTNKLTPTQAQTVIAAAVLRHLHAVITTGTAWDPAIATQGTAARRPPRSPPDQQAVHRS